LFKLFSAFLLFALILINPISSKNAEISAQTSGSFSEYTEFGTASWYGPGFHGRKTANGERFDTHDFTCAHKTLPFNTMLKVTNLENGRYTIVRVNDRGPFIKGRIIDLSQAAKSEIGMGGLAKVKIERYEPVNSSDESEINSILTLFENAINKTSKVFVELKDVKNVPGIKNQSNDEFMNVLSTFKKVKVIVDNNSSNLNSNSGDNSTDNILNFIDLTSKINTFTGYSIEIEEFESEQEAQQLIGKLESLKYSDIILVELITKDSINFKVYVGYYRELNDANIDLSDFREMNFDAKVIKVLS